MIQDAILDFFGAAVKAQDVLQHHAHMRHLERLVSPFLGGDVTTIGGIESGDGDVTTNGGIESGDGDVTTNGGIGHEAKLGFGGPTDVSQPPETPQYNPSL